MADRESSNPPPIPISEHSRVLIAMHKAMGVDSQRLIGAVDTLPAGDTQQAAALGRAFAAIVGLIHDHHWTEDDVIYPFLLERVPTFEDDALRLENDHVELDAAMARINARFRLLAHQLSARLWQDTRSHLLDEAAAFNRVLVDHLDREEAVVVPPLRVDAVRGRPAHPAERGGQTEHLSAHAHGRALGAGQRHPGRGGEPARDRSSAARRRPGSGLGAAVCRLVAPLYKSTQA